MNREKEQIAIERLRAFEPKDEPYYLCYSGGKDSDCIRILAQLAGVRHELHHNLTSVDAPETVAYIKSIPGIQIDKARFSDGTPKTMWNLMPIKRMPPTRIARWCCLELKEGGGKGRLKITGVRWAESSTRMESADVVRVVGKQQSTQKLLDDLGVQFRVTKQGGVVLNCSSGDNEALRDKTDAVHHCYRDRTVTVNPIVDWSDRDVWEFLHHYGCDSNPLYKCGEHRIGCIGCPIAGAKQQKKQFARYPKYKAAYTAAFDRMVKARKRDGLFCRWDSGEEVMKWWLGEDADQLTFFGEDELYEIFNDMGVT